MSDHYREDAAFEAVSDADVQRLFDGALIADERLVETGQFLADLDAALPLEPTAAFEGAHLSAMMAAAASLAVDGPAAAEPAPGEVRRFFATRWARVAAVAIASLLALGGVAYAASQGALTARVQDSLATAVRPLGINLHTSTTSRPAALRPMTASPSKPSSAAVSQPEPALPAAKPAPKRPRPAPSTESKPAAGQTSSGEQDGAVQSPAHTAPTDGGDEKPATSDGESGD